jgi:type IV pilus assembly protein PilP
VQPIPEPKVFTPQDYGQDAATDPFSNQKLAQALKRDGDAVHLERRFDRAGTGAAQGALESYPLDSMAMVGSLIKTGKPVALVRVDNLLYQVRPATTWARTMAASPRSARPRSFCAKSCRTLSGEWIERTAKLQLQEGSTK